MCIDGQNAFRPQRDDNLLATPAKQLRGGLFGTTFAGEDLRSRSFGVSVWTLRSNAAGSLRAGAGFKNEGNAVAACEVCRRFHRRQRHLHLRQDGIGRAILRSAAATSSGCDEIFAERATAIMFSRPRPPTKISATPLGAEAVSRKWRTSIPSRRNAFFAVRPNSSRPWRPMKDDLRPGPRRGHR